jgi:hypothetical protein
VSGFGLSIEGFLKVLTTDGVYSAGSTDLDWPIDAVIGEGMLVRPEGTFVEELDPLKGDCNVSQHTFTIRDRKVTVDGAERNYFTYMTTRRQDELPSTVIKPGTTCSDTGLSFFVADPDALDPLIPGPVWIDREAILCDAIDTGTGEVTVNTDGRGYLGTLAAAHDPDESMGLYPTVWGAFPWITWRKVVLWLVDDDGNATPFWRGHANRPASDEKTLEHQLQCEPAKKRAMKSRLGETQAACRLRGFNTGLIDLTFRTNDNAAFLTSGRATPLVVTTPQDAFNVAGDDLQALFAAQVIGNGHATATLVNSARIEGTSLLWNLTVTNMSSFFFQVTLGQAGNGGYRAASVGSSGSSPLLAELRIDDLPPVLVSGPGNVPIDRADRLPVTVAEWSGSSKGDGGYSTYIYYGLRGAYSADVWVTFYPAHDSGGGDVLSDDDSTIGGGASLRGRLQYEARRDGVQVPVGPVDAPLVMRLSATVSTDHWAFGLKWALQDTIVTKGSFDVRDWDFDRFDDVAFPGHFTARLWHLDGTRTIEEFLLPECIANGACLSVRDSRYTLVPLTPPPASGTATLTLTEASLVHGMYPQWWLLQEGIVNAIEFKSPETATIVVQDTLSLGSYGEGRKQSVNLEGLRDPAAVNDHPEWLSTELLARALGIFNQPLDVVRLFVKWSYGALVACGDTVDFTDWRAPNGEGGLGNVVRRGFVKRVAKTLQGTSAYVALDLLCFPPNNPISPCARLSAISSAVLTVAGPGYVGSSDYAGSNLPGYTGTANDGGTSFIKAGDRVELYRRDDPTGTRESAVVLSVNIPAKEITLTGAPNAMWAAGLAASPPWDIDVRYDAYDTIGLQATQKKFAWVGDYTTNKIAGTATPAQKWQA